MLWTPKCDDAFNTKMWWCFEHPKCDDALNTKMWWWFEQQKMIMVYTSKVMTLCTTEMVCFKQDAATAKFKAFSPPCSLCHPWSAPSSEAGLLTCSRGIGFSSSTSPSDCWPCLASPLASNQRANACHTKSTGWAQHRYLSHSPRSRCSVVSVAAVSNGRRRKASDCWCWPSVPSPYSCGPKHARQSQFCHWACSVKTCW